MVVPWFNSRAPGVPSRHARDFGISESEVLRRNTELADALKRIGVYDDADLQAERARETLNSLAIASLLKDRAEEAVIRAEEELQEAERARSELEKVNWYVYRYIVEGISVPWLMQILLLASSLTAAQSIGELLRRFIDIPLLAFGVAIVLAGVLFFLAEKYLLHAFRLMVIKPAISGDVRGHYRGQALMAVLFFISADVALSSFGAVQTVLNGTEDSWEGVILWVVVSLFISGTFCASLFYLAIWQEDAVRSFILRRRRLAGREFGIDSILESGHGVKEDKELLDQRIKQAKQKLRELRPFLARMIRRTNELSMGMCDVPYFERPFATEARTSLREMEGTDFTDWPLRDRSTASRKTPLEHILRDIRSMGREDVEELRRHNTLVDPLRGSVHQEVDEEEESDEEENPF